MVALREAQTAALRPVVFAGALVLALLLLAAHRGPRLLRLSALGYALLLFVEAAGFDPSRYTRSRRDELAEARVPQLAAGWHEQQCLALLALARAGLWVAWARQMTPWAQVSLAVLLLALCYLAWAQALCGGLEDSEEAAALLAAMEGLGALGPLVLYCGIAAAKAFRRLLLASAACAVVPVAAGLALGDGPRPVAWGLRAGALGLLAAWGRAASRPAGPKPAPLLRYGGGGGGGP